MLRNVRNFYRSLTLLLVGVLLIIPVGLILGSVAVAQAMYAAWWPVLAVIRSTGWIDAAIALAISVGLFVFVFPHSEVAYG